MNRHEEQGEREDAALVMAAQRGDKAAFGALIARHRPLLFALCRRALGDADLAADAAQEAVLQALLALDRLRRPERFGSWLAGIGLNVCHRLRRQRVRDGWSWDALLGGRVVHEPCDPAPGPEERAEAADLRRRIERAVAELPPGQRAAVMLHYLEGLTQAETALQLGIEIGAVKTRLHKARAKLRRTLWTEFAAVANSKQEDETMIAMRVADVRRRSGEDQPSGLHVVFLEEIDGERRLPIWVGEAEATALAVQLEQIAVPRPLTYAFAAAVLRAAGGALREVRIDRLEADVFYATAVVVGADGEQTIDARPSDALNLAVLLDAPIRVAGEVLAATTSASAEARAEQARLDEYTDGAAAIAAVMTAGWSSSLTEPAPSEPGTQG